jgi:hypothetical protein
MIILIHTTRKQEVPVALPAGIKIVFVIIFGYRVLEIQCEPVQLERDVLVVRGQVIGRYLDKAGQQVFLVAGFL